MYSKINHTGCVEYKGMAQIRIEFYLDPEDYGYEKHVVNVPIRPLTEEERENPELAALVPTEQRVNPFHNHFVHVDPSISKKELKDRMEKHMHEAYGFWIKDEFPNVRNPPHVRPERTEERVKACE